MGDIQISFIIPVYNVEKYLKKNIESVLALKDDRIEFIYVNDGSTDNSKRLLDSYAAIDKRMIVVDQENLGLSVARNVGMELARGKWILFIDGDDWIDTAELECFLKEKDEKYDIIWGSYSKVAECEDGNVSLEKKSQKEYEERSGIDWLNSGTVDYMAWVYLYKTAFIKYNYLKFPPGLLHEDMEFVPKAFILARNVKKLDNAYYKYVVRPGSITTTKSLKRSTDLIQIADNLKLFYEENKIIDICKFMRDYLSLLCRNAIHLVILSDYSLENFCRKDLERKGKVIKYMSDSSRTGDKIISMFLKMGLERFYEKLYLIYHSRKNL